MVADNRVEALQEEIKLLKGELKHSLASVRDYLLNSELPSAELSSLSSFSEGEQKITMKGSLDTPEAAPAGNLANDVMDMSDVAADETDIPPEDEDLINVEPPLQEDEMVSEEPAVSEETTTESPDSPFTSFEEEPPESPRREVFDEPPSEEVPEEEVPMEYQKTVDTGPTTPRVNLLANLITWVARAKKDIGYEQLPVFLEVYGLSGHLSPELKEVILHFADITSERPDVPGDAETWSQAMLTLHGILTGGDAPLHPTIPSCTHPPAEEPAAEEDELIEVGRPPGVPVKLKLIFPDRDGKDKEYCIDLAPEANNGEHPEKREQ